MYTTKLPPDDAWGRLSPAATYAWLLNNCGDKRVAGSGPPPLLITH
jgi:hypothetical protein